MDKYEEALKRAKELHDAGNFLTKQQMEIVFPELRESEDETIKKWLIDYFNDYYDRSGDTFCGMQITRILAYLEKQKENPKSADSIPSDCMSDVKCEDRWHKTANSLPDNGRDVLAKDALGNYLIASFDGAQWFVSVYDGEDHPVLHTPPIIEWCDIPSETCKENADSFISEDERIRKEIISALKFANDDGVYDRHIAYLENQKINTEGDFGRGYDCGYEACLNSHGAEWFEKQKEIPMSDSTKMIKMRDEEKKILERMYLRGDTWRLIAYNAFIDGFARGSCVKFEKQKEQKPTPDWMPKFLDELRSKKNYFDWDEHRDLEGQILAIINWIAPNYFNRKEQNQKPVEKQDYSGLNDLERAILRGFLCAGVENVPVTIIKETAQECLAQMKPAEWSGEDDVTIKSAVLWLEKYLSTIGAKDVSSATQDGILTVKVTITNLKSLRPSWKPSEEQTD